MDNSNISRWRVVFGAIMVQICIGAVYSWSLFNAPLVEKFGWSKNEVVFTFSIVIFVFAFTTIFSGKILDKIGPKKVSTFGGIIYSLGLVLTSRATSITELYIFFGVISGIGIGLCYVCPLSTCIKWFPDKKGLITGITVGAFGLGSLVFKPIITHLLSSKGVSETFLYLGVIYFVFTIFGSQFLKFPPTPNTNQALKTDSSSDTKDYTVKQMIKTRTFKILWIIYLLGTMSGLLVIGLAKDIGVQLAGLQPQVAANVVPIIAIFNTSGRLVWGTLSDKLGRIKVISILFAITSVSMFYMSFINVGFFDFFVVVSSVAFCFGGFLAVFPAITGDYYGMKNMGANYGIMYQAYGISALLGPMISANTDKLVYTFIIAGILAIIGIMLTFTMKKSNA